MNSNDAVVAVIDAICRANIPYMIVGSYSSNFYGVARATRDADIVIQTDGDGMHRLVGELTSTVKLDPQSSFETITGTYRYVVHVLGSTFQVELFLLSNDPFDQCRFSRRQAVRSLDRDIFIPTAEDVIVQKVRWASRGRRTKDIEDARLVIQMQRERLDWDYIRGWCDQHGSRETLEPLIADENSNQNSL